MWETFCYNTSNKVKQTFFLIFEKINVHTNQLNMNKNFNRRCITVSSLPYDNKPILAVIIGVKPGQLSTS